MHEAAAPRDSAFPSCLPRKALLEAGGVEVPLSAFIASLCAVRILVGTWLCWQQAHAYLRTCVLLVYVYVWGRVWWVIVLAVGHCLHMLAASIHVLHPFTMPHATAMLHLLIMLHRLTMSYTLPCGCRCHKHVWRPP